MMRIPAASRSATALPGVTVPPRVADLSDQEVNTLLNQFKQMQKVMKTVGKTGGMGLKLPFGRGPFPG